MTGRRLPAPSAQMPAAAGAWDGSRPGDSEGAALRQSTPSRLPHPLPRGPGLRLGCLSSAAQVRGRWAV